MEYIIQFFAFPATFIAAVAWLAKVLVSKGIEHSSQIALEGLRHEFNLELERSKTKYSTLQQLRIEPLLSLYFSISDLVSKASHLKNLLTAGIDLEESEVKGLYTAVLAAQEKYNSAILFMPENVESLSNNIIYAISSAEMSHHIEMQGGSNKFQKACQCLLNGLKMDLEASLKSLARELKELLGVENA